MPPLAILNIGVNESLGTSAPPGWVDPTLVHNYLLQMVSDIHGRPTFEFIQRPLPGGGSGPTPSEPHPQAGKKSKHLDLKIPNHVIVRIRLDKPLFWQWAPKNAVTTGTKATAHYFLLEYFANGIWVADPDSVPCDQIQFRAKKQTVQQDIAFNMNVIIVYDNNEVLPVSIDPDIRNPGTLP
ncbi:MAG: nucleotide synthetase [Devosia sp.]